MRSSELQAKVDAMEPEVRKAYQRRMEELFAVVHDIVDTCGLYPEDDDRTQESAS